jgi:hypothetical protein
MKNLIFATSLIFVWLLVSCGGSKPKNDSNIPDYVLNPPKEAGVIYGTGIAKKESAQLAKETADLRAKKEIAAVLGQRVSNLMKDFMGESGINHPEVTEFVQSVTKAVSDVDLIGVEIVRRDFVKGNMYSLAKYKLDGEMRKLIQDQVQKSLTSREALLSEFRAKQGFDELDKELKKLESSLP